MILILIFVRENSYLYPSSGGRVLLSTQMSTFPTKEGWKQFYVNNDRELWIHHKENIPEKLEWEYLLRQVLIEQVKTIYITLHSTGMTGMEKDIRHQVQQYFPKVNEVMISLFSRERENEWARFSDLLVCNSKECSKRFDELCEIIRKKNSISDFSTFKHRLTHLFLPIDIDLQGWAESGFNEQYREEIAKEYEGKAVSILNKARSIVYRKFSTEDKDKTFEAIIDKAIKLLKEAKCREELKARRERVYNLLPENNEKQNDTFQEAYEILLAIQTEAGLQGIKERLQNGNPFNKWFQEIDKAMDELREKIPK